MGSYTGLLLCRCEHPQRDHGGGVRDCRADGCRCCRFVEAEFVKQQLPLPLERA